MLIKQIPLQRRINETGELVFLEGDRDIPFTVKRIYYIFDVAQGARRGRHAHRNLQQILICIHGSCKVLLDDGHDRTEVMLDDPTSGLLVESDIWREMYEFSPGAVLLVLASEYYDEADYIRDYDVFLKEVGEHHP